MGVYPCLVVVKVQPLQPSCMPQAIRKGVHAHIPHGVVSEMQRHYDATFQGGRLRSRINQHNTWIVLIP